jgi:hypothetical protein
VLGSFIAGSLVSRTGHYRIFPICGAAAMTTICVVISLAGLGRWWPLDTVLTAALGLSFGFQLLFALPFHTSRRIDAGFGNLDRNVSRTYNAEPSPRCETSLCWKLLPIRLIRPALS